MPWGTGVELSWTLEGVADDPDAELKTPTSYDVFFGETLPSKANYTGLTVAKLSIPAADLVLETAYQWKIAAHGPGITYSSEIYSFTTASLLTTSNAYGNGSYLWFDVTLGGPESQVDFLALKEGETPRDKATVLAYNDTDGETPLDGMHFRDALKPGQVHRILLYNLDFSTTYKIYAYFQEDSGAYASIDEGVLESITTKGMDEDLGHVEYKAHIGQDVILPPSLARSGGTLGLGEGFKWSSGPLDNLDTEALYAQLYLADNTNQYPGSDYDAAIHGTITRIVDSENIYFLRFEEIPLTASGFYRKDLATVHGAIKDWPHRIRLEVNP